RSAAFGNVTGANVVGGLIGAVANTAGARYSFALGDVTVTNANNAAVVYAGGFIAHSGGGNAASIFESFSYGNVISLATSGTQNLGGFVGRINSASIRFTGNVSMARQIITHPDHIGTLNIAPVVASSRLALNATALYYEGFKHIVGDGATLVSQTHAAHLPVSRDYFKDINTFINLGWDFGIQGFIMDDGHLTEPLTGVPTYHFYMIGYYICADRSGHIYRYTGLPMHRFMHPRYANRVNFVWSGTGGEFANGLSNAQTLQQLRVASFNARVANPLRVGYTFTGWYNMPSCAGIGGVENNAHEIITSLQRLINVDGSINCVYLLGQIFFARGGTVFNFYAHWSVNIGTMRFVCLANGITKTQNLPGASFMVATGVGLDCIMEISNVARSGYILKGFYFGGIRIFNADGSVANSLNGGIVPYKAYEFLLEAVWEQIQFSAAFYALGNRLYCLDTVTNYYAGFGVVLPTLYKTSSHYFVGWQVANSELGIQNSELLQAGQVIVLSADVLFVAVWQFRSFGVAFEGHYEVYSLDKVLLYGSIVILPELVVARENYEFVGWLVNGELTSVGVQIAIYVDTTILAVWAFVEPPIEDYPVCDYPVCDYPILDCPVDDYPLCDYPICEYPIVDCPIDDYPVDDCPVDDYPVDECPVDDYPILDCPVEDYPVDDYPIIDYPADDYPTIDLPNYDCCEYPELCEACAAEQNTRRSNWWLLYIIGGCAGGTGLYGAYRAVADSRRRRLL
ncbi:MAG: InlB B-repeat-containing protein, partial [Firmicutes bacterium]|nr:InlB B-repeat-containing protein [Bacillota bacterium]